MPNQIPLDPKLPKAFDNTPNEARSKEQLDAWWDHPYGVTLESGKIMVRCLNGGAWDRSTQLGVADDYDSACKLAEEKQAAWVKYRSKPIYYMDDPKASIVIMPQRPDQPIRHLVYVESAEQVKAYMSEHFPEYASNDEAPPAHPPAS